MSSSNVSSVTSHFATANEGFTTTTAGSISAGANSIPLNSVSGLTNGSVFVGIIEPGVANNEQTFTGIVDISGSQLTGVVWTRGTNVGHAGGVTIVDYVTGTSHNMVTKGLLVEHNQDGTHKSAAAITIGKLLYPVGSLYFNASDSTSPATLLGFGTWIAFAGGRVPVGAGTSDQAFAAGATGGESNHTLVANEIPAHTHSIANKGSSLSVASGSFTSAIVATGSMTTDNGTGGGASHNNLQPYIVVYIWKRTV